jgi:DNA-binding MarR family transcriptional regulator
MSVRNGSAGLSYVTGEDGLVRWADGQADAWIGLLETHKRLTRTLDAELDTRHGLSISATEVLARLAAAEGGCMRLSKLAEQTGLSLSRISRIIDALAARGLLERRSRDDDARAVEAHLTSAGLTIARSAQASHMAAVQRVFFDRLSADELTVLARVFARFVAPSR